MTTRSSKPVTVTLGALGRMVQDHVASGRYASASEVVRAGLRALEREEAMLDKALGKMVSETLAKPGELIPHDEVFARLEDLHRQRTHP